MKISGDGKLDRETYDRMQEIKVSRKVQAYCRQLRKQGIKFQVVLLQPKPLLAALPDNQPGGG